ncbi:hypothetical protein A1359_20515 [Methylomonas lenta]|uniref:Uncharacterized protein n=1 Tax=Methylomonas lenta TaxID=980561 RepID=A0A177NS68_9GAMM|nr:hypothetical protein [Methylomonas lenta]OAI20815.1 hypothetical protein A1359_20515 [Methylomonas lenta]
MEDKKHPNQGITLTLKNSLYVFLFTGFIFSLVYGLIGLKVGLFSGLLFGLIISLACGLGAVIKHYSLRLALCLNRNIPFKFIPFLDYSAKLILLKKVGGGYIFIHRMLLEYFAGLATKKPY